LPQPPQPAHRSIRTGAAIVAALALALGLGSVASADTADDIERVSSELQDLQQRADELAIRIEASWERQATLETDIRRLTDDQALIETEFVTALGDLEDTAVRLYMDVASGEGMSAMLATSDAVYATAVQYLSTVAVDSEAALTRLVAAATELERRRTDLGSALDAQAETEAELAQLAAEISIALEAQSAQLVELEALRAQEIFLATSTTTTTTPPTTTAPPTPTTAPAPTTPETTLATPSTSTTSSTTSTSTTTTSTTTTTLPAPDPAPTGGGACPVAGPVTFADSWGAPRSGGRAHEGVDMIAARGTPIAAIYSGVIQRTTNSALGGITIWMRSDGGDEFYYAHLDGYADGVSSGVRVAEGQVIGYNGSSGNAPDYLPHLHFEYHPGGGSAVNPYSLVRSICG
jgi:murein DD-endopeptidase MepM/ murein hydrolase activator NlpD